MNTKSNFNPNISTKLNYKRNMFNQNIYEFKKYQIDNNIFQLNLDKKNNSKSIYDKDNYLI